MRTKRTLSLLLCLLLGGSNLWAALDVRTVWETNTSATAGNVNGGGFDYISDIANMLADLACTSATGAAPVCTSASYAFIAGDVGHWLFVSSGGTYQPNIFCQIASVAMDAATLTAGSGTCNVISTTYANWYTNSSPMTVAIGIATTASPTGGVFSIDRSRSTAAAQTTATATNTVGVFTVGGLTYNKTYIGNIGQIVAGTGATVGWYRITQSTVTVSFTLDRDPSGTTNISINIGGAISLGSTTANRTDDSFFELMSGTNGTGGSSVFVKTGAYVIAGTVTTTAAGGTLAPVKIMGYSTIRGEVATVANYPEFTPTNLVSAGNNIHWKYIAWVGAPGGTQTSVLALGSASVMAGCSVINKSTTASKNALTSAVDSLIDRCELVSYLGTAFNGATTAFTITNSVIHDSQICITTGATASPLVIRNNIVHGCVASGAIFTGAQTSRVSAVHNTFFGATNNLGVLFDILAGGTDFFLEDNIFQGAVTCVTHGSAGQTQGTDNYNNYFDCTTDATNWRKGPNTTATDPAFTNVVQITGTNGSYAGSTLTSSGADFSAVVNGTYILVKTGNGLTTANSIAKINSHTGTTIVTDNDLGESGAADWVFQTTQGLNFLPTVSLPGSASSTFPGGYTTGYSSIGAVDRNASAGGGSNILGGGF